MMSCWGHDGMKLALGFILAVLGESFAQDMARVVGGLDVTPQYKYSWMVAIFRYDLYSCGGTLVMGNKVLTAAHCIGGAFGPLEYLEVQTHRHNLTRSIRAERGEAFSVVRRWVADGYENEYKYNDVAILEIDRQYSGYTEVMIDETFDFRVGRLVTVLGWGAARPNGRYHPVLQEVRLPLVSREICQKAYLENEDYEIEDSQFCAGYRRGGKDACQGDSGGPIFVLKNKRPLLIGVVSSGLTCAAPGEPGLYMRVASYSDWIWDVLNGRIPPTETLEL